MNIPAGVEDGMQLQIDNNRIVTIEVWRVRVHRMYMNDGLAGRD